MIYNVTRQGSTPTHTFFLPFSTSLVKDLIITYEFKNQAELTKRTDDCKLAGNRICVPLTQEDTFSLTPGYHLVQIRILTLADEVFVSDEYRIQVIRSSNQEVLK